jgi:hypothetical protein
MRRCVLGAAVLALLFAMAGCGGGGSSTATIEQEAIPSRVQSRLGIEAQRQLRLRFHDRRVEVTDVECERQYPGASVCRLSVVDGSGRRGIVLLAVQVDPKTRGVRVGFAGASNRHWLAALRTPARGAEAEAPAAGGSTTTTTPTTRTGK